MKNINPYKQLRNAGLSALIVFIFLAVYVESTAQQNLLWYAQPAADWNEALPIGNGRLGAMIFGGVQSERLQLNEESVWTGRPIDFVNPEAKAALPVVRQLLFEGKYAEAQQLAQQKLMGYKNVHSTYQTLGDLYLRFDTTTTIQQYKRSLDLATAVASVTYTSGNVTFTRESFSSTPDQVVVTRLTASQTKSISFTLNLSRPGNHAEFTTRGNDELIMREHVGNGLGVTLVARVKLLHEGGRIDIVGNELRITEAHAVTILVAAATDYAGGDPAAVSERHIKNARGKSYAQLKARHIKDYQQYFNRVTFSLGTGDTLPIPTDERLTNFCNGKSDRELIELYYQFGRYLLISSSRPGDLPANLQGIWADGLNPPWEADYHININIQMNYWLAEITNLSELHMPFLQFVDALREDGRKTARDMYGVSGTVAHFTTDAWRFTEPYGETQWAMWPMGMAWCARHCWEHYCFTGDRDYLKKSGYPVMKEAAEFCLNYLVENPATRKLVSGPSISPENTFRTKDGSVATMVMGPTMDHMIIRDLLEHTLEAGRILQIDAAFAKQMEAALARLSPTELRSDGRIMEWTEAFEEPEPGHRHISHLYGLYPGNEINRYTPELQKAARKTIAYRLSHGGGHTGWSRAWIINFFARLEDGNQANDNLTQLLCKSTLSNLFDNHPPFQIDGNFGATAGITEMLLQSHAGEVHVLPALPEAWQQGSITGLCARGGFEVSIQWKDNELETVTVLSKLGNALQLRYQDKSISMKPKANTVYRFDANLHQTLVKSIRK